jgi:hypothetical protein
MSPDELRALSRVTLASPCPMTWSAMRGSQRSRFCSACQMTVYNLSALTTKEATALLERARSERVCAQFFLRTDGTVMTRDCPSVWKTAVRAARLQAVGEWGAASALVAIVLVVPLFLFTLFADNVRALWGMSAGSIAAGPAVVSRPVAKPARGVKR